MHTKGTDETRVDPKSIPHAPGRAKLAPSMWLSRIRKLCKQHLREPLESSQLRQLWLAHFTVFITVFHLLLPDDIEKDERPRHFRVTFLLDSPTNLLPR